MTQPAAPTGIAALLHRHRLAIQALATLAVAVLAFAALHRLLASVDRRHIAAALHAIPGWRLVAALLLTAASYLMLTLYDVLALRLIGRRLAYGTAALASFTSYTLSHNLGFGLVTGGSARLRIYGAAGLSAGEVAQVIALASGTFWSGVLATGAVTLLVHHAPLAIAGLHVSVAWQRALGLAAMAGLGVYGLVAARGGRRLSLGGLSLPLPGARQGSAMIALATCDLVAACGVLFVLMPHGGAALFAPLFFAYLLAIVASLASHVPGGIGVFEATVLLALPGPPRGELMAALIAYRLIYHLLPLIVAIAMLVAHERRHWQRPLALATDAGARLVAGVAPLAIAMLAFVGGLVLLVSGAIPAVPWRLAALRDLVPLPFIEASHLAASLAGTGLLLLAPALYRRLDSAFVMTRMLLLAGAGFSLAKGFDYEEALTLLLLAALLQLNRRSFYRRTALTADALSPGWLAAALSVLFMSLAIGLFANHFPASKDEMWWQFAWHGDASRFLRAGFAASVLFAGYVLISFHAPASTAPPLADAPFDPRQVLAHAARTDAMLALTGDKRFLAGPEGRSFVMYQIQGHSWIAMGDPVGDPADWPELLWRLREMADAAQGRVLLYQISAAVLPIAIDMGLQLIKYGEEARVNLARFTLDGPDARPLRHAVRRAERDGAAFSVVPAARVPLLIPELRSVSDHWLAARRQGEKAFSVGRFDPAYLAECDMALVRCHGQIAAFANVWKTSGREELSVDLMRHGASLPYGCMDYLFSRLMLWGRDQGYDWFNLGLAPLAGIDARRLAPVWAHAGALLYRHGEALYGFEGLRAYKDKFAPLWEPRYIAGSPGVALGRALIDLQTLVGGGRKSVARRPELRVAVR
ncbi:MAG: bifunctional lysylphosphatidylglycerol flippase/synthetase MprF [Sphingomonadales bacterium]|nr:bifunctional lysylphosphatidylglycerol flippase/synthetase MprF [Sphingomonadales bacterium]